MKKRVCLVIPSLQAGGMERVMSELADYFVESGGKEVHLLLYGRDREQFFTVPDEVIVHKPGFRFNNRLRLIFTVKTLCFIRQEIKRISPDSILSFGELWNSFVLLGLMGLKFPVFISDRCSPERSYKKVHALLRKLLYPRADGIIVQTEKAKDIYSQRFRHSNICVIGNPIREIKADKDTEKENLVLMVGRLIESKHQDELIRLFLEADIQGWRLEIVGYDHLKQKHSERLQEIIDQHEARDRVSLEGKQAGIDQYYSRSRIFAFTSSSEGFPNVIGEAMSAGVPVVAFDCVAGPSDMIRDEINGYLIPLFDYEQFREKLARLMHNTELREGFGELARLDIQEFSLARIGEGFEAFILQGSQKIF